MSAVKRPVNLTISEALVKEAKTMTDNLSGVVESLLTEFVAQETAKRTAQGHALKQTIAS